MFIFIVFLRKYHKLGQRPVCVYLSPEHPLAGKEVVSFDDLKDYPFLVYEQDHNSSTYFYEDVISSIGFHNVIKTYDRGTMMDLVGRIEAYTIGMGIVGRKSKDLVSIRLDSDESYIIGYIKRPGTELSAIGKDYLTQLKSYL